MRSDGASMAHRSLIRDVRCRALSNRWPGLKAMREHGVVFRSRSAVLPNNRRQIPVSLRAPVITISIPSATAKASMISSAARRFSSNREAVKLRPNGSTRCARASAACPSVARISDSASDSDRWKYNFFSAGWRKASHNANRAKRKLPIRKVKLGQLCGIRRRCLSGIFHLQLGTRTRPGSDAFTGTSVSSMDHPDRPIFTGSSYSNVPILITPDKDLLLHVTSQGFHEWRDSAVPTSESALLREAISVSRYSLSPRAARAAWSTSLRS
jgi:hypothetical protein